MRPKIHLNTIQPRTELVHRLLTFSCRTQGSFTVRNGALSFDYGRSRLLEFDIGDHAFLSSILIPADRNYSGVDLVRVRIPCDCCDSDYYPYLEKHLMKVLGLETVQTDNFMPLIGLEPDQFHKFLVHGRLLLNRDFKPVRRKRAAFCEFAHEGRDYVMRVFDRKMAIKEFVVYLHPRIQRGKIE